MSGVYDTDILVWSAEQAALLRRLAAGERVNDRVDWTNVIEEIESVGNEQLHAVSSLLTQAMIHRLKAMAWPDARDADNWRAEAECFAGDAADRFAPSMLRRLNLAHIYRRALLAVPRPCTASRVQRCRQNVRGRWMNCWQSRVTRL